jgi:c-di-GMP-binding flagellar brake protein YcgR
MMLSHANFALYPLQVRLTDFQFANKPASSRDIIFLIVGTAVLIALMIILNIVRKRSTVGGSPIAPRHFSGFALHRGVSGLGLDRDQIKMLDYAFKSDNVVDIRRSLSTPTLLDRHFFRAYRLIERTAGTENEAQEKLSLLFSTRNILESYSGSGDITSTRQIQENTAAVLDTGKEKYPVKILSAKGDQLVVEHPENALGTAVPIARSSKVNLSFFTKSKGFSFESRILNASDSANGPVLQLIHSSHIKKLSQRRFRRRQMVISANYFFVHLEATGRKDSKMVVDKRRLTGNIMDISAGGCSIKTNVSVTSGTRLKIEAATGSSNIAALGQVLRTNRSGMSTIMHIKFLRVPQRSLNTINALVYEYLGE